MIRSLNKRMVLLTIILMDLLTGMEFDLFVPSFPELRDQFSLTPFWVEALLSFNFIGYCLSLFVVGSLADRYGRKPIIFLGLIIFIVGSLLCLSTASYPPFIIGRFLQGVGVAAPAILSFLIVADAYPLKQQQFLMAILNGTMNVSVAAAPVIGSYVAHYFHWQGNFRLLLILGVIVLGMTTLFVPLYKLSAQQDWLSSRGYKRIVKSQPVMLMIIHMIFIFAPYWIFVGMSPLLYMEDLGVSLRDFGYYQGSLAFIFALGSILYAMVIHRLDQKRMLLNSIPIFMVSFLILAIATFFNSAHPLLITLAFFPFVIGQIIPATILYPLCINFIPSSKGRVSAIIQGARLILSAIGLQLAGYCYQGSFQNVGIVVLGFTLIGIIALIFVSKNQKIIAALGSTIT